jgi:methylmalonyl-CoA mutase
MSDSGRALPDLRLGDEFPPVPAAEWEAQALRDLGEQAFETRLLWRTDDGLTVKPFFTRDDLAGLPQPALSTPSADVPWRIASVASWSPDAVRADRVHDAGGTAVHELAWAVAEVVDRWAAGVAGSPAGARVDLVCAVGSTYFVEIAKLRAVRRLWARAQGAFDNADVSAATLRLHARTARANKSVLDPYTNLLRVTTEAMAAVIGGADVVFVEPHGFAAHLAVNVQHLLAHEAHLGATADPAFGAYYVEWLTDALAAEAWRVFQEIEAAGGYAAALDAGLLRTHLMAPRQARQRDVATRRRTLVGVNTYPDPVSSSPSPASLPVNDAPLPFAPGTAPPLRLAQPFEDIRARTVRHAASQGRPPIVQLLTRGDLAARTARAAFSRNLFGCAGFTIVESDQPAPDADLVVLCGADADYATMLDDVASTVTAPIVVAGRPDLLGDVLPAERVHGFVHARSDAVEVLSHWQDRLGMAR